MPRFKFNYAKKNIRHLYNIYKMTKENKKASKLATDVGVEAEKILNAFQRELREIMIGYRKIYLDHRELIRTYYMEKDYITPPGQHRNMIILENELITLTTNIEEKYREINKMIDDAIKSTKEIITNKENVWKLCNTRINQTLKIVKNELKNFKRPAYRIKNIETYISTLRGDIDEAKKELANIRDKANKISNQTKEIANLVPELKTLVGLMEEKTRKLEDIIKKQRSEAKPPYGT
ncbi:hypothetical protein DRJ17_01040 [Candidatus Woesearchaeota archaeon]|nr:MAG: hypothetical protein DRJ17_01040 [Candidatus Woesearchaeota archaeon]